MYLLQAGVVGLERLGKPKVLTLNNELEITQTKGKKECHTIWKGIQTLSHHSAWGWGGREETPIKQLEDAIHSLDWASGETRLIYREK